MALQPTVSCVQCPYCWDCFGIVLLEIRDIDADIAVAIITRASREIVPRDHGMEAPVAVTPVTFTLVLDIRLGLSVHAKWALILFCPSLRVVYAGVRVKLHLE